jgi:hypothetical protein
MATDPSRRRFLAALAACTVADAFAFRANAEPPGIALLGAWSMDGREYAGIWDRARGPQGVELPFRAHQVLLDPRMPRAAIAIARRPGEFIARLDLTTLQITNLHVVDSGWLTNGHALFTENGRTLLVSENDSVTGTGSIALYDADTLELIDRYSTFGIGPHAILQEPDGSLLVANGGVLTAGATGRQKLNAGSIDASLVRLDPRGRLLGKWRLSDSNLSIRHLARAQSGMVGVALQAEHPEVAMREEAPVFALFDGRALRIADPSPTSLKGYAGDITCIETPGGALFWVGCSQAGVIAVWDETGRPRACHGLRGACALAPTATGIVAPSEYGEIGCLETAKSTEWFVQGGSPAWDNHAVAIVGRT